MSSGKPLDIGRFSVHCCNCMKIKGLKDSFLWIPAFAGMTKGSDKLKDLPIPKFVEPAMC